MSLAWTPWHQVVALRDDLKSGELAMNMFAADLYEVVKQNPDRIYHKPYDFFALTYPTDSLLKLAKDVVLRLAGKNDKAVRQLELTYGGGKTHTLITLYHLVNEPSQLPVELPAMKEFLSQIGQTPPKARIAVMPFDKFDVERGMLTFGPAGETKWLRYPWSVLAYQLAGAQGLRLLHKDGLDEERETPPAQNLLDELLAIPEESDLATLILMDEVLMYARGVIGLESLWLERLTDFFQYLTQAAINAKRCAIVVSLLATDPSRYDTRGKEIARDLFDIFRRVREETVQPVQKEDVAEVLRRRFFKPESLSNLDTRAHVLAALQGIEDLDEPTQQAHKVAAKLFADSYPFHPDLIDVFYTKWTNLQNFQRTRGILRTFALALREAVTWDNAPLIATNIFLARPGGALITDATLELTGVAMAEEYQGRTQSWKSILESELGKAVEIQEEYRQLHHREVEQAVMATFLHSQPSGHKASLGNLLRLVGHTRPDKIDLSKALKLWTEVSWFLDESMIQQTTGKFKLPETWRLGSRPNLQQMHHDACRNRVSRESIDYQLNDVFMNLKDNLVDKTLSGLGAESHWNPKDPSDIGDNVKFHFAVLSPNAASEENQPSAEAKRFIEEGSSADRPRVHRNGVVLLVPSQRALEQVRLHIQEYLGWLAVASQLKLEAMGEADPLRTELIENNQKQSLNKIKPAMLSAYVIVVTMNKESKIEAFKLKYDPRTPIFDLVKADERTRIQEAEIAAQSLLPGEAYHLWREGETSRQVRYFLQDFAENPQLPKLLNQKAITNTLISGCEAGLYVLRLVRPDKSQLTFWRVRPDEEKLKELELVLPAQATLSHLPADLLQRDKLPQLWEGESLTPARLSHYFSGQYELEIPRDGWSDYMTVPKVPLEIINQAIQESVKAGQLWFVSGQASLWKEDVPSDLITPQTVLRLPPTPIQVREILPEALPVAWQEGVITAKALSEALGEKLGQPLPWLLVEKVITSAIQTNVLERTQDSFAWPTNYSNANNVKLRLFQTEKPLTEHTPFVTEHLPAMTGHTPTIFETSSPFSVNRPNNLTAQVTLKELHDLQTLCEHSPDIVDLSKGYTLTLSLRLDLSSPTRPPDAVIEQINQLLAQVNAAFQLK